MITHVLLALAACAPTASAGDGADGHAAAPVTWVVSPVPGGFPLGAVAGRLGRSQAPQPIVDVGIAGPGGAAGAGGGLAPLHLATVLAVPGGGPARAVVHINVGGDAWTTTMRAMAERTILRCRGELVREGKRYALRNVRDLRVVATDE